MLAPELVLLCPMACEEVLAALPVGSADDCARSDTKDNAFGSCAGKPRRSQEKISQRRTAANPVMTHHEELGVGPLDQP